jgi:uncharacterized membrane protein
MNLPVIPEIPVQIPFEIPALIHPMVVHFAMAIPVIVLLLELANIKAKNRAVSVTSLFLLTLMVVVFAAAYYTGKVDGTKASDLMNEAAKGDLAFHKLLGLYLMYGAAGLFVFKLLAMMVRKGWARDLLLLLLAVFIFGCYKQGREGGELVYEHGANVEAVSALQTKIKALNEQIEAVKQAADKLKQEEEAAPEATQENTEKAAPEASAEETAAPADEAADQPAQAATEAVNDAVEETVESAKAAASEAADEAADQAQEAVESAKESANEAADQAKEAVKDAVQNALPEGVPAQLPGQ